MVARYALAANPGIIVNGSTSVFVTYADSLLSIVELTSFRVASSPSFVHVSVPGVYVLVHVLLVVSD